ncbi:hypothetical protein [Microbacterium sp. CIAB417]|uniref:hypothetical protein n=1 Tax=Microbacterium sp. CIAB417 TaxID=2860287 RepID=UPI001FAE559B|nr:hypothetical protein [Microbacterium sp. CIAB417]
MNQSDMLFLVLILIGISSLALLAVQLLRRPKRDDRGEWYEGPWDDDDKPRR